jgi:DNA-binding NtrC family response regulator
MNIHLALIICQKGIVRDRVTLAAARAGLAPICCESLEEACDLLAQGGFRIVLSEDVLPDGDFRMAMRATKAFAEPAPFIVLAEASEWESYLNALAAGVFDYILCPPSVVESETIVRAALAEAANPRPMSAVSAAG